MLGNALMYRERIFLFILGCSFVFIIVYFGLTNNFFNFTIGGNKVVAVYVFSVIINHDRFKSNEWNQVVVNGWEGKENEYHRYKCCSLFENNEIRQTQSKEKKRLPWGENAPLLSVQFVCELKTIYSRDNIKLYPTKIGIVSSGEKCSYETTNIEPFYVHHSEASRFGIGGKTVYGNKSVEELIEWVEFHKQLEASLILVYVYYDINFEALKVLKHYNKLGYIQVIDVQLVPELDEHKRHIGYHDEDLVRYHDEQVINFDIQSRLSGYKYFIILDTDEFILPKLDGIKSYSQMMDQLLAAHPDAASFRMLDEIHLTNWGVSTVSDMLITSYSNHTEPIMDRAKNLQVTSRIVRGSAWIHTVVAKPGYKWYDATASEVVLKHFRSCRDEWLTPDKTSNHTRCYHGFKRLQDSELDSIATAIRQKVKKTQRLLGITNIHQ